MWTTSQVKDQLGETREVEGAVAPLANEAK